MTAVPHENATDRNRQPILDQLVHLLPAEGTLLEIGSGTGQHAGYFIDHLGGLRWQPSERAENLADLAAFISKENNQQILDAIQLDVITDCWPEFRYVAAFSANTAHIMPWDSVKAMFEGVATSLIPHALFCLYGPFNVSGQFTSPGNQTFDRLLRLENKLMGIRDMAEIENLSQYFGMTLIQKITMPANNFILVFEKN